MWFSALKKKIFKKIDAFFSDYFMKELQRILSSPEVTTDLENSESSLRKKKEK